ncbi:MAG: hypothetical protein AVDCRST_MAG30-683 [uncultured Solirubrobacteraceae bacterium]|uniref:Subtilisin inhibitor domain-containing protein n=1 Tax=uncultured Solirubrobacteraceae bacterium TaxID=1162706 RepID=A0A6J4RTW1_9ACTN|nr:MAG: hypothetical protein AVDCRST_MAG30-683 [uncultured Solirubrobacteraceae bacterium]
MRVLLLIVVTGLAACGEAEPAAPPAARTSVAITVDRDGEGGAAARTVRLRCPSPRREAACRALAALPRDAFAPPPGDQVCTEIYGGPETARIAGTVDGRRVDATYARTDGCGIARFERVAGVLRAAGG